MMCRNVKMLAAAAVAVVVLAAGAWAQGPWKCGTVGDSTNVIATLGEDGTLTVSGTGAMANYNSSTIPWAGYGNSITGIVIEEGVTNIGNYAFYACSSMTSVTIGGSVTSIGNYAFYNTGLTSVTIPDGVTSIGNYAFQSCKSLTDIETGDGNSAYSSVDGVLFDKDKSRLVAYPVGKQGAYSIPTGVTSIGLAAFYNCTGLTSATIPSSVTSIGSYVFYNCTGLTSVTIPNSVTTIGQSAFTSCTGLTSVTIPSSVTYIGQQAFAVCTGLTSVTIPSSVTSIELQAFYGCTGLTSVTIPSNVTSIGNSAFYLCTGLTSVTIPNSVASIGNSVFFGCTGLTSVTSLAVVPPTLGTNVFQNVSALLYVPEGSADAYMAAAQWNNLLIPGSSRTWNCGASPNAEAVTATLNTTDWTLTISGTGAMANYTNTTVPWASYRNFITGAVIEEGVTNIGNYTFSACSSMTSVTIPSSVTSFGTYVFSGCTGLASVTIGSGVTSIGNYAFQNCAGLTSVTIPSSVTSIGTYVFSGCTGLASVTIGSGVTSIGNYAFQGCAGLTSVTIPSSVTSIGNYFVHRAANLTNIEVGDNNSRYSSVDGVLFTKAQDTLVRYPEGKNDITYSIPESVTSIYMEAFYNGAGLTSVTIPNSVTSIGNYAFQNCTGLTSVTVPNGVTSIGTSVFSGCTGLTSVTIGSGVESIGNSAFSGCTGLTSVTSLIEVPPTINSNVFNNVPVASATLYVPEAVVEAYRAADVWQSFGAIEAKPPTSVASGDRVIPQTKPKEEATVIASITALSGEFTAGPNPVSKQSGSVNFYRQGKRVGNSELRIYDATGNVINKVKISDKALNSQARRQVGSWDLKDSKGRPVSEGTYLVKGVVKTSDGKGEKVSVILGVR